MHGVYPVELHGKQTFIAMGVTKVAMTAEEEFPDVHQVLVHPERWCLVHGLSSLPESLCSRPSPVRKKWSLLNAHTGTQREILLCLSGNSYWGMDGKIYKCCPGMLFVVDPLIPHDNQYPETADGLEH